MTTALSHLSPGIVGMYWLLGSVVATAAWSLIAGLYKRAAR